MITIKLEGLENLVRNFQNAPLQMGGRIEKALFDILTMMETESKRFTPVDTGLLRSSIGAAGGFKVVRGLEGEVGTNIKYAVFVHEGHGRHNIGERLFMEKGARASTNYIEKRMNQLGEEIAKSLTK